MIEPRQIDAQVEIIFNQETQKYELFIDKVKIGEGSIKEIAELADKRRFAEETPADVAENNAKRYLRQIEEIKTKIRTNSDLISQQEKILFSITQIMKDSVISGGGTGHGKMENAVINICSYQEEINSDTERLIKLLREVTDVINSIEDYKCRNVLYLKYICLKSFEQIAEDMDMSCRNVYFIHRKGLLKVSEILESRTPGGLA